MIALQTPELVQRVERFARAAAVNETVVVETAVERYLDQIERDKIHAETVAFWKMHARLRANYLGQYVAIHEGKVVDHDHNVLQLEQRVVERFGDIALLIAPVPATPQRELRRTGFKLEPLT
jgi:hypothetical protein